MNSEAIEAAVAAFLEQRDSDPGLTPDRFIDDYLRSFGAASRFEAEELRLAIQAAIEVDRLLPGGRPMPLSIGPYRILREIGRGGMGIVYEVVRQDAVVSDESDESARAPEPHLALKLHPVSPLWSARAAERLRREISALAGVSHENIVRIREWGDQGGAPYIVMDLVDGTRLDEAAPALAHEDAVRIVGILARAAHEAHVRGVIHRDLKPQNVILREDGTPVLVDFGLSLSEDLPSLTVTGELIGTPRYMAPEQVHDGKADARTDVYALGLILYELLTRRPARGSRSREGLLREASVGSLEGPRRIDPTIPAPLERVVLQALAVAPEDRYQSAAAFADDLDRYGRRESVTARPRAIPASKSSGYPYGLPYGLRYGLPYGFPSGVPWRRVLTLGIVVIAALAGIWQVSRIRRAAAEQRRASAEIHVERAFEHHLEGDSAGAIAEARKATSIDPSGTSALALSAHLSRGDVPSDAGRAVRALQDVLQSYAQKDYAGAKRRLAAVEEVEPGVKAMLAGVCAEEAGENEEAEQQLLRVSQLWPNSTFALRRLAGVYRKQGILLKSQATLVRATEIDSTSAALWTERASLDLVRRDLESGFRSVAKARALGDSTNARLLLIEAELRSNSADGSRARQLARQVLEQNPDHAEAWYQLGFAHDVDHQSLEARDAYERAIELVPGDARAWFCLANLYSGASRGECVKCDAVYAAHPELLDLEKAESALIRTLEIDRGRQEWVMRSATDISMRLTRRDRVIALVDALVAADPSSPPGLRLAELARRLRLTSG